MEPNLPDMPIEVVHTMLSAMSYEDAKRTCSVNPRLKAICDRADLLDLRARQYVAKQAPLGQVIHTFRDYANLIQRGFKTTYHMGVGEDYSEVQFGSLNCHEDQLMVNFDILGLPPPKGTTVWVLGDLNPVPFMETPEIYMSYDDIFGSMMRIGYLNREPDRQQDGLLAHVYEYFSTGNGLTDEEIGPEIMQRMREDRMLKKDKGILAVKGLGKLIKETEIEFMFCYEVDLP